MSKLSKYNEFLIEKEFKSIVDEILILVESNTYEWDLTDKDKLSAGDTVEWDILSKKKVDTIKDEPAKEIVWDFSKDVEQQSKSIKDYVNSLKSGASKVKSKLHKFRDYIRQGDVDIEFDVNSVIFNKIKEFIKGLDTKEQVKKYFYKLLEELKELPYKVKKDLFVKLSVLIMSVSSLPIGELISDQDASKDKFLSEVKTEVASNNVKQTKPIQTKQEFKGAKFDIAQNGVHNAEGKYTDDRDDSGNWTGGEVEEGMLLGTKFGIAAPTLVDYYNKSGLGTPSQQDMIDLTYETALEIYKKDYWDAQELSNFKSQSLANVLYDGCVNQGPGATLTILKKSLDEINIDSTNVNSWNELHDELIDDVNSLTIKKTEKLFHTIKKKRWEKYIYIIKDNPRKKKYHNGWKNRLDDITFNDDIDVDKNIDIS